MYNLLFYPSAQHPSMFQPLILVKVTKDLKPFSGNYSTSWTRCYSITADRKYMLNKKKQMVLLQFGLAVAVFLTKECATMMCG